MHSFHLDHLAYEEVLNLLNNQHFTEKPGDASDTNFLCDDWWLRDAVVIDHLVRREGLWEVQLVFAYYKEPLQLIIRPISRHASKKSAQLSAYYMRRLASKDQRGTLNLQRQAFKFCKS